MKKLLVIISVTLMLILPPLKISKETNLTFASTGEWELLTKGIDAGTIRSIAVDPKNPKTVYAGSWGSGIYKSIDGGDNWFKPYEDSPFVDVNDILIDPSNTSIIYASTFDRGIWKSLDGGVTWGQLYQVSGGFLSMDPLNNKVLYFGEQGGNIYKTEDAGISWKLLKTINGAGRISISVDPKNPSVIYAGAEYVGFFKSVDGGTNWNMQNTGLANSRILCLKVDPTNPQNIYLGTIWYENQSGGIFKSTDGGQTWTSVLTSGDIWSIEIDPKKPNNAYAGLNCCGVYKTVNGGATWERIDAEVFFQDIAINPVDTNILYAGTNGGGVYKSIDAGKTWRESSLGINDVDAEGFAIDPKNIDTFYVAIWESGFYKTTDGGKTWERKNNGLNNLHVSKIFIDPLDSKVLYVLTGCGGLYKTIDSGNTWTYLSNDWDNRCAEDIKIDPNNHMVIYAGISIIQNPNGIYLGVLKSENGGSTWKSIGLKDKEITEIQIDPVSNIIYVGTKKGLLKSDDQGKTWKDMNLPYYITSIAIDTKNSPNVLYVGTDANGGFKTTDGGKTWNNVGVNNARLFVIDPSDSNTIYEGTWGPGVYKSTNGGQTWVSLPGLGGVFQIALDPNNPKDLYVSTRSGLYRWITKYTVVAKSSKGGTISPSGTTSYKEGESQTFSFTSLEGYRLKDVKVDNVSIGAVPSYTLNNINTDHTIEAIFEPITFTITATASFGGSISPQGNITVNYNDTKIFYISPEIGYRIKEVIVDGKPVDADSYYVFDKVTSNHSISVIFEDARIILVLQVDKDYFTINNTKKYLDSPPIIKNGRTLVPIRAIIEALGGTVSWDPSTKTVDITLNNNFIRLQIGNAIAYVNGEEKVIDPANYRVVPEIINGRTMLPLRFVAENLGCDVKWDGNTKTITITYTGG